MTPARSPRFDLIVGLGCIVLLGYFAWHAWYGPRGWQHEARLRAELDSLRAELAASQALKDGLEAKVALMRPESIDADMLEELARSQLNWAGPDDLFVRFE